MDFITGLPHSNAFTIIMVVVDRLSKFAHFLPLKADYNSKKVAELFIANIVKLHGIPRSIVSDRDKVFISQFWQQLFKQQGTTLAMSSAYHPQTDGQSEVLNKTLEMYLRCFCFSNPKKWLQILPWAEYWYNTSFHHSIGMTPFRALYGRDPPTLIKYEISNQDPPSVQEMLMQRDLIIEELKKNMLKAQQYMKEQADKKRRPMELQVGDAVLVKLQPYRQNSVALRKNQKLGLRYFGPFKVVNKISAVAYKLQLPEHAQIHPVFHISLLKKFKGDSSKPYLPMPLTTADVGPIIPPQVILATRTIKQGEMLIPQVLVQWQGTDSTEATWEDWQELLKDFPTLNLEDKVVFNGGGIVTCGRQVEAELDKAKLDKKTNQEFVTASGQMADDPQSKDHQGEVLRRSHRMKESNRRLKGYHW